MNGAEKGYRLVLISLGLAGYSWMLPIAWAGHFRSWSIVPRFDVPELLQFWLVPMIIFSTLAALAISFLVIARGKFWQRDLKPLPGVYLFKTAIPPAFFMAVIFFILAMHYYEARFTIMGVYLLLMGVAVYLSVLSWKKTGYEIGKNRLLTRKGVIEDRVHEIPLGEVIGVLVLRPSWVDYLFDTGSVVIRTREGRVSWQAVPSPEEVVRRIGVGG